jgi:hypothetical protein
MKIEKVLAFRVDFFENLSIKFRISVISSSTKNGSAEQISKNRNGFVTNLEM